MDLFKCILLVSSLAAVMSYHTQSSFCTNGFIASWSGGTFNGMSDRVYQFDCASITFGSANCTVFTNVNSYNADFNFTCAEGAISGVDSYFSDSDMDRQFTLICCDANDYVLGLCTTSNYINNWQETYTYLIQNGTVIKGVESIFNSTLKDRRWKIETCLIDPAVGNGPC